MNFTETETLASALRKKFPHLTAVESGTLAKIATKTDRRAKGLVGSRRSAAQRAFMNGAEPDPELSELLADLGPRSAVETALTIMRVIRPSFPQWDHADFWYRFDLLAVMISGDRAYVDVRAWDLF